MTLNNAKSATQHATLGGGCFWCLEAVYQQVKGVHHVESGYAGGETLNPDYDSVCSGRTGHAEVVRIDYDPQVISYKTLLEIFFAIHDPTTLNRQGHDVGNQYRSVIYFHDSEQEAQARSEHHQQHHDKHRGKDDLPLTLNNFVERLQSRCVTCQFE